MREDGIDPFGDMVRRGQPAPMVGTGSPGTMLLEMWAQQLRDAFDSMPYLVGSAFQGKNWRDVDVRILLDDDEWERLLGPLTHDYQRGARWAVLCTAISIWGQQATGLPIDFQFMPRDLANEHHPFMRNAIGLKYHRWAAPTEETT